MHSHHPDEPDQLVVQTTHIPVQCLSGAAKWRELPLMPCLQIQDHLRTSRGSSLSTTLTVAMARPLRHTCETAECAKLHYEGSTAGCARDGDFPRGYPVAKINGSIGQSSGCVKC